MIHVTLRRAWFWGAAMLVACTVPRISVADVLLYNGTASQSMRFGEDGSLKASYSNYYGGEEPTTHALSSDQRITYQFWTSFSDVGPAIPYSAQSGQALVTTVDIGLGYPVITGYTGGAVRFDFGSGSQVNAVHGGSAPRFHFNTYTGADELFLVHSPGTGARSIKRFSGVTGEYLQTLPAPAAGPQISDFAFGLFGRLYAATNAGIYVYQSNPSGTYVAPQLLVPGDTGQVASFPSVSLLVNSGNAINRYNEITGQFIGNALTLADLGADSFRAIEFDAGGTLYVLHTRGLGGRPDVFVSRVQFTGLIPSVLSTVQVQTDFYWPDMFLLPVPEPNAATLAAMGFAALLGRRRRA